MSTKTSTLQEFQTLQVQNAGLCMVAVISGVCSHVRAGEVKTPFLTATLHTLHKPIGSEGVGSAGSY